MARRATQTIERPIDRSYQANGLDYRLTLVGTCRDDGTWEGRIRFDPLDGSPILTPVESTQPNERLLIDWVSGLGSAFYDGAFRRASGDRSVAVPPAMKNAPASNDVDVSDVERQIIARLTGAGTVNRQTLMETIPQFSNADVQRGIDQLERKRQIVRFTDRGSVWIALSGIGDTRQPRDRRYTRASGHPELVYEHPHPLSRDGREYIAVVIGLERDNGTWGGWWQFRDVQTGGTLRTGQETSQPNRDALEYWATGVEHVYLDDALRRAVTESANASDHSRRDASSLR